MISASSEALSKPDRNDNGPAAPAPLASKDGREINPLPGGGAAPRPAQRNKRLLISALAILVAFVLLAGPSIFLNMLLKNMFPPESGLKMTYDRAKAGFLFKSVTVEGVKIQSVSAADSGPALKIESVFLKGVSLPNLISLTRAPAGLSPAPLYLAKDVSVKNVELEAQGLAASISGLNIRDLLLVTGASGAALPLLFDRFEADGLKCSLDQPQGGWNFSTSRLEARKLDTETLGSFRLTMLTLANRLQSPDPTAVSSEFNLNGFSAGGLKLAALKQAVKNNKNSIPIWWLLSGCDTLELAQGALFLNEVETISLKSALYDFSPAAGDGVSYTRKLAFGINADNLAKLTSGQFWADLNDIAGDSLEGELSIAMDYSPAQGQAAFKNINLDIRELGRLEVSGSLDGVQAAKAHYSPYQLLFGLSSWRMEHFSLTYDDRGLAKKFYRHLDKTTFRGLAGGSIETKIINFIVNFINDKIEGKGGPANLPAVYSEVEAFVNQPAHLRLSAKPEPPLSFEALNLVNILSLANIDKYDILKKLRLTIEVNQRAPVFVAVESGLSAEKAPAAPRLPPEEMELPFPAEEIDLPFPVEGF